LSSSAYIRSVNFIKVNPNTQYVISYNNSDTRLGVYEYDINKNFIRVLFDANARLFTASENAQYLKLRVENNLLNATGLRFEHKASIAVTHTNEYQFDYSQLRNKIIDGVYTSDSRTRESVKVFTEF
jgi:hypothetical protein